MQYVNKNKIEIKKLQKGKIINVFTKFLLSSCLIIFFLCLELIFAISDPYSQKFGLNIVRIILVLIYVTILLNFFIYWLYKRELNKIVGKQIHLGLNIQFMGYFLLVNSILFSIFPDFQFWSFINEISILIFSILFIFLGFYLHLTLFDENLYNYLKNKKSVSTRLFLSILSIFLIFSIKSLKFESLWFIPFIPWTDIFLIEILLKFFIFIFKTTIASMKYFLSSIYSFFNSLYHKTILVSSNYLIYIDYKIKKYNVTFFSFFGISIDLFFIAFLLIDGFTKLFSNVVFLFLLTLLVLFLIFVRILDNYENVVITVEGIKNSNFINYEKLSFSTYFSLFFPILLLTIVINRLLIVSNIFDLTVLYYVLILLLIVIHRKLISNFLIKLLEFFYIFIVNTGKLTISILKSLFIFIRYKIPKMAFKLFIIVKKNKKIVFRTIFTVLGIILIILAPFIANSRAEILPFILIGILSILFAFIDAFLFKIISLSKSLIRKIQFFIKRTKNFLKNIKTFIIRNPIMVLKSVITVFSLGTIILVILLYNQLNLTISISLILISCIALIITWFAFIKLVLLKSEQFAFRKLLSVTNIIKRIFFIFIELLKSIFNLLKNSLINIYFFIRRNAVIFSKILITVISVILFLIGLNTYITIDRTIGIILIILSLTIILITWRFFFIQFLKFFAYFSIKTVYIIASVIFMYIKTFIEIIGSLIGFVGKIIQKIYNFIQKNIVIITKISLSLGFLLIQIIIVQSIIHTSLEHQINNNLVLLLLEWIPLLFIFYIIWFNECNKIGKYIGSQLRNLLKKIAVTIKNLFLTILGEISKLFSLIKEKFILLINYLVNWSLIWISFLFASIIMIFGIIFGISIFDNTGSWSVHIFHTSNLLFVFAGINSFILGLLCIGFLFSSLLLFRIINENKESLIFNVLHYENRSKYRAENHE